MAVIRGAQKNLEASAAILDFHKRTYQEASRQLRSLGTRPEGMAQHTRQFAEAIRANRSCIADYTTLRNELSSDLLDFDKANKHLASVKDRITKIRRVNFTDLGKDLGADLGVAALKEGLKMWMDDAEQQAWLEYFQQEVVLAATSKAYLQASNQYWNSFDRFNEETAKVLDLENTFNTIKNLIDRSIQGDGTQGDLNVYLNDLFYDDDGELELIVDVANPSAIPVNVKASLSATGRERIVLVASDSGGDQTAPARRFRFAVSRSHLYKIVDQQIDVTLDLE